MSSKLPVTLPAATYDTIDIAQIVQSLRRQAGLIAAIVAATTLMALLHTLLATPQFTANGALYLGAAHSTAAAALAK